MISLPFALLQADAASPNPLLGALPMLLIFGIFYFVLFMPLQRQRKTQQKMLSTLQPGQTVVTTGGLIGTIVTMNADDTLILRVKPSDVKLQVARSAVSGLVGDAPKA